MADLPANQSRFELAIDGVHAPLHVLRFSGEEALSAPFRFVIGLASPDPALNFARVIDHPALLTIHADGPPRLVHGIVERFTQGEPGQRFTLYELDLVPAIRRLHWRHDCRIFQHLSVPDIVAQGNAEEFSVSRAGQDAPPFSSASALENEGTRRPRRRVPC